MFSGVSIANIEIRQLILPLVILITSVLIVTLITKKLHLPDIANTRAKTGENWKEVYGLSGILY